MKIGFIIGCHGKIDDLMAHLDILRYCPFDHQIIIVHSMDYNDFYMKEIDKYHHVRIDGKGHHIGPLLCVVGGIRKAHELDLDYTCYRNADDWLFSYEFEKENFDLMEEKGYLCAGYSWMGVNNDKDVTLNQLYMNVNNFHQTADDAESYFLRSGKTGLICEYKMSRWIKRTLKDMDAQFYRLPDREQLPGIGWEEKDIPGAFAAYDMEIPDDHWDLLQENNRYFNKKWKLIGSHDNKSRLGYWRRIRSEIPYARKLEKEHHFARWLQATRENLPWNIEIKEPQVPPKPPYKPVKPISRKIFL